MEKSMFTVWHFNFLSTFTFLFKELNISGDHNYVQRELLRGPSVHLIEIKIKIVKPKKTFSFAFEMILISNKRIIGTIFFVLNDFY